MKVSYNWLQEYFDKPLPNPKDLADLLNIRAFEVEDIEERDGDSVLEIKITPDRAPDCLSHLGVAREVAIHTGIPMKEKTVDDIAADFETNLKTEIEPGSAHRHMCREIRNVVVQESPLEIKLKLEAIGQRPINTIVDITNIVLNEIGQPMHAFDADKIAGNFIRVGVPTDMHLVTLDGKEVELTAEDITLQDTEGNLDIAGVKGGKKAELTSETKNIIFEAANFYPTKVRRTSKRVGIQTDSSKRFENGLSPRMAERAMRLASFYVKKYASSADTKFSNVIDVYPRPQPRPYSVGLKIENVSKRLGVQVSEDKVLDILKVIGIKAHRAGSLDEIRDLVPQLLGAPYKYGASVLFDAPKAFDCSSLVSYLFGFVGIQTPRMTVDQFVFSQEISKDDLKFGDLIFSNSNTGNIYFESKEFLPGTKVEYGVDHVGIYMGDGNVLHASRYKAEGTLVEKLADSEQFSNIVGYRRIADERNFPRYVLEIPHERLDLKIEMDIIEEIGRIYGYEHIVPAAPDIANQPAGLSVYDKLATIKSHLVDLGFDEVVTYSFQKKGDIAVSKPLAKDKGYLREDLTKGLTDALDLNFRNKELFAEDAVRIFEVGHVFKDNAEKIVLGIAARSASKKSSSKVMVEEAWAYLKEKLDIKFASLSGRTHADSEVIEIDLESVLGDIAEPYNSLAVLSSVKYKPFSPYPFMTRDIAVWAANTKAKQDVESVITRHAGDLLVRYDLFDQFTKEDKTSYAYRLVFQSHERTLTDEEINPVMDKIYATLQSDSDFEIR